MIILRSLCLLHHASSSDNITHVVIVDDDSAADCGSTAVRRPFRVGDSAMQGCGAVSGLAVDFGYSVRQPFDGLSELMLCFASMPSSVRPYIMIW